jgi:hypothetical protein
MSQAANTRNLFKPYLKFFLISLGVRGMHSPRWRRLITAMISAGGLRHA